MSNKEREALIQGARKILADKSWPIVTGIFFYPSSDTTLTSAEEVSALRALLEARNMPNTIRLAERIKTEEERLGVKVHGVSIILMPRDLPSLEEQTPAQTMAAFTTPDIMIGTRPWQGNTTALQWLTEFAKNAAAYPPEPREVFDNIIAEAVKKIEGTVSRPVTLSEMINTVSGEPESPAPTLQ